jgi:hypothetical protein
MNERTDEVTSALLELLSQLPLMDLGTLTEPWDSYRTHTGAHSTPLKLY